MASSGSDTLLIAFAKAAVVHVFLFIVLFTSFHTTSQEKPLEVQLQSAPVIKATAISSDTVKKQVENKQRKIDAVAKAERDRKNKIRRDNERKKKAEQDRKRKIAQDKKRKADLEKKRKVEAEKKRQDDLEKKRKAEAEKKRLEDLEKKRKADAERKRLQDIENRRIAEQNAARQRVVLSEVDKYKALIINKISRNWIVANQTGSCKLEVRLAAGGFVIDVKEVSGGAAVCRSAQAAVYKADPLPVSSDPEVFNKMRTLLLDLDPQDTNR